MQYVTESSKGALIFPYNIPRKRGRKNKLAMVVSSMALLFAVYGLSEIDNPFSYIICSISVVLFFMITAELVLRLCLLFEEVEHFHSRYNDDLAYLLMNVFGLSQTSIIAAIVSLFGLLTNFYYTKHPFHIVFGDKWMSVMLLFVSSYILAHILKFEQSPVNVALQINNFNGLDYGSGMANSFFHGYLRLILPYTGLQHDKGIREFQQDYESRNNIRFEMYKLFILIPMSQHCPARLNSEFSPSIEESKELESKKIDRAGVQKRDYKNSVYKINTRSGQKKYVCAEYATPVKTLQEVMKQNTARGNLYYRHRKEILLNFYLTLRKLLKQDPDCRDSCELIYYDDMNEKGEFLDVGGFILHRLERLKRNM